MSDAAFVAHNLPAMRILVIEDDLEAASYLIRGLTEAGHVADHAADGENGLRLGKGGGYDALVVDRMLPAIDGLSIVQKIRESGAHTPVIFLSALGPVRERVRGLRSGADDYLAKPFSFSELLARLEALVRRARPEFGLARIQIADLCVDRILRKATRAGNRIHLKPREFQVLEYLARHAGQVVTRTMLLENVWDYHFDPETNVVDVHVSRLRGKIDKGYDLMLLHTVRGVGYSLFEPN